MAKAQEALQKRDTRSLFDKYLSGDESVTHVNDVITSGRRWDVTQKEVKDEVIVIFDFETITTQYGESYLANAEWHGEPVRLLVGGQVLRTQLEEMANHLPVVTVIRQPGRSYVFDDAQPEELAAYQAEYLNKDSDAS